MRDAAIENAATLSSKDKRKNKGLVDLASRRRNRENPIALVLQANEHR